MAVPIRAGSRILGCLSLIWISSALTIAEAESQFLPPLRSLAQRIDPQFANASATVRRLNRVPRRGLNAMPSAATERYRETESG